MTKSWTIRPFHKDDAEACAAVFFIAIEKGASGHYNRAQREAWAERSRHIDWVERLGGINTIVALGSAGSIVGFASLRPDDGYLDLIFVRPEMRGTGLADALVDRLTDTARALNLPQMSTHASLVARSFFARHGWQEEARETIERGGVELDRFVMRLRLRDRKGNAAR